MARRPRLESRRPRPRLRALLPLLLCALPAAAEDSETGLSYLHRESGETRTIGSLGSSLHLRVTGVVATASVWQIFENPTDERIDALYTFPIPERVAVDRLEMSIGDRIVKGVVRETAEAERIFLRAASEGRAASLVRRERSNVFSTSVANIPPRGTVEIAIGWQQEVDYASGVFSLRLPTVLASRYGAAETDGSPARLPAAGGPERRGSHQLGLRIDLDAGIPLAGIHSPSHEIVVEKVGRSAYSVALAAGVVRADRDFVLEWRPEPSSEPRVGVFSSLVDGERYVLLLVVPPPVEAAAWRAARDVVFVIDTSGSMAGDALAQAKAALLAALERLGPDDTFDVIRFSTRAEALFSGPAPATAGALADARAFVEGLEINGGTEMMPALRQALNDRGSGPALRQVVFITDGRVEGEEALFQYIATHLGRTRLFTVGIGPTPNSYFLRNAARHGRGSFTHVSSTARVRVEIGGLLARLEAPALTDLSVGWPDALAELAPDPIPDLYAGEPLSVAARLMPLEGSAELGGWREHERWDESVALPLSAGHAELRGRRGAETWGRRLALPRKAGDRAIAKLWAARRIEALTDRLITAGAPESEVRERVLEIALRHRLVSPYTSLVAEDLEVAADLGASGISIQVTDEEGNPLPGAAVEAVGGGAAVHRTSGVDGGVRLAGLASGAWQLRVTLDGFSTVEYPSVEVPAGRTIHVDVELSQAVAETITVTSESPLLDEREAATAATISGFELEKIPTARDPWAVVHRAAGVTVDWIHAGGDRPPRVRAPAATPDQNQLLVDGVEVTGLAASDGSSCSCDLDQLTEMRLQTGGADAAKPAAGVSVHLVTKRGTNALRGSASVLAGGAGALPGLDPPSTRLRASRLAPGQPGFVGDALDEIEEGRLEAGGPWVRDRLWLWGAHGRRETRRRSAADRPAEALPNETALTTSSLKVNAQPLPNGSVVGSWSYGDRRELGRGASPDRAAPTTWDERGTTAVLMLRGTHVVSSNLFFSGGYSRVDADLESVPKAVRASGDGAPQAHLDDDGVWRGSFLGGGSRGGSAEWTGDGSYFFNSGRASHELRFGVRLRELESVDALGWSNGNVWSSGIGAGLRPALLFSQRGRARPVVRTYASGWLQDTVVAGRLTVTAGLRYDLQRGRNEALETGASAWFPSLQPAATFAGADAPFEWRTLSPRIGLTYALGEERRTLLRAGAARFPEPLRAAEVSRTNPAGPSYLTALWYDTDGSGDFNGSTLEGNGPDEVIPIGARGFDLDAPGRPASPNRTDPGLEPETTDEIILGVEHALQPELVVGLDLTRRRVSDIREDRALVRDASGGVRVGGAGDYVLERVVAGALPDGTPFAVPVFGLDPALSFTGGALLTNGDRERDYRGLGLEVHKRMSAGWMLRGYLQYGEAEWRVPAGFRRLQSPNLCEDSASFGCEGAAGGMIDGGLFAPSGAGLDDRADAWLQSTWQFNVNGRVRIAPRRPWGFDLAANLFGREGHPLPYFFDTVTSDGEPRRILAVDAVDRFRTDDLFTADLRFDRELSVSRKGTLTVGLDVFNLFDARDVLERERGLSRGSADFVRATLEPRIFRLTLGFEWR